MFLDLFSKTHIMLTVHEIQGFIRCKKFEEVAECLNRAEFEGVITKTSSDALHSPSATTIITKSFASILA